ncbi:transporter substrate-binding domain-containing protein [Colwellia sp. Arc7-635]|uniref:substrate-binding periplasmic protein n=1 Tax=Colwellia sp. Arc7-635 TaxID=2497879 RepID=UPI0019D31AFF|nr:transporter substrate-binding domain-containing protein [Colwellia sp. Arc7-635]
MTSRAVILIVAYFIALFFITLKAQAKPTKTIIVAMYIEPPFSEIVDGKFIGENIDITNALAAKLGYKTKFVYCPLARCLSFVQSGQADMIIAVRKTAIREKFLHYLEPPIKIQKLPLKFYTLTDNDITLNHYNDLLSLKVGVLRGASYFDQFDHDTQITKVALNNHQQLIDMLLKGRIDTFLEREESILPLVDQKIYSTDINLAKFSYDKGVGSYIAVAKKSSLINEIVDLSKALQHLSHSGELALLLQRSEK